MYTGHRRLRVLATLLCAVLLLQALPSYRRVAAGSLTPLTTTLAYPPPPIMAAAAAMLDVDTGQWLYLSHADTRRAMASTTKIMTAILAIGHGRLNALVRVSHAAATIGQSTMGLRQGEQVRVRDLLYGLLLPSGNDAAIALAEFVGGTQAHFVEMMNAKAAALHLHNTHYETPHGLDAPDHYSSARDLVILARYAMSLPLFRQIVDTKQYVVRATAHNLEHRLTNINEVLYWYPGVDGIKPGQTDAAGLCQVIDAHRFGRHVILAIMNTPNLYTDARDLLDYGFGDFSWVSSGYQDDTIDQVIYKNTLNGPMLYYPYSGHGVQGSFSSYYRLHGGIEVFGMPRTEAIRTNGQLVQFFTNIVLAEDPRTDTVLPERLGLVAVPSSVLLRRVDRVADTNWRTYYPQTGHTVTYRFRQYYLSEGGPATLGYPVTEKFEQSGTLVQYFENAVLVWHATSGSTGFVGMAPLGQQELRSLGLLYIVPHAPETVASPVLAPGSSQPAGATSPVPTPISGTPQTTVTRTQRLRRP